MTPATTPFNAGPWALAMSVITFIGLILTSPQGQELLKTIFSTFRKTKVEEEKPTLYELALENNIKINQLLDEDFRKIPGVFKAVIIESKNGGGIPAAGGPLFSSVVMPQKWASEWWNQLLDAEYSTFILELIRTNHLKIKTDLLDKHGLLYPLFEKYRILYCEAYAMKKTNEKFYFLAVDFYIGEEEITPEIQNDVRILVNKVRSLINS